MSDPTIYSILNSVYDNLTPAESIPIIGVVSSAAKGVIGVAQAVLGLAFLLLSAPFNFLCEAMCVPNNYVRRHVYSLYSNSLKHLFTGLTILFNSVVNIETLGLAQYLQKRTIFLPLR